MTGTKLIRHSLNQESLSEWFSYDPKSGFLYIKERPRSNYSSDRTYATHKSRVGLRAEHFAMDGYLGVCFKGHTYGAHRVAWVIANGEIPQGYQIDHINGVRRDNRAANLRAVTRSENLRNSFLRRDNKSGYVGVFHGIGAYRNKWTASCAADGITYTARYFESAKEASAVLEKLKIALELGFGPVHGNIRNHG